MNISMRSYPDQEQSSPGDPVAVKLEAHIIGLVLPVSEVNALGSLIQKAGIASYPHVAIK